MSIGPLEVFDWRGSYYTFAFLIIAFIVCARWWMRYLRGTKTKPAQTLTVSISNLLQVINLGVTAVSILLPATGALVVYMASHGGAYRTAVIRLMFSVVMLGLSLFVGLWNAFDYVLRLGVERATWDKDDVGYPLFFMLQFVLLIVGTFWIFGAFVGGVALGG